MTWEANARRRIPAAAVLLAATSCSSAGPAVSRDIDTSRPISTTAALAGACGLASLDIDASSCAGIDAYAQCAVASCGAEVCATGSCRDYVACLADAGDPCNSVCTPSSACTCLQAVASCAIGQCLGTLSCGATTAGGACDALDVCCDGQPDQDKASCRQAASVARIRGDATCQQLLDLPPDSGVFYTCPPPQGDP